MRAFLFLYPTKYYVSHECERTLPNMPKAKIVKRLNQIIHRRYRQRGYQIFWLVFGRSDNARQPDVDSISPVINVAPQDKVISAGVRFYADGTGREFEYARSDFVLRQMGKPLDHVVLGGFHQNDCVDKMGRAFYEQEISVVVDEHLTHRYFILMQREVQIPDRCRLSIDAFHPPILPGDDFHRVMAVENRKNKPWFVQT
jgi:hypothetical protein